MGCSLMRSSVCLLVPVLTLCVLPRLLDASHTLGWSFARLGHRCWSQQWEALLDQVVSAGWESGQFLQGLLSMLVSLLFPHLCHVSGIRVFPCTLSLQPDFHIAKYLCSSESKFLHHSLDILLVWFHHIIPWHFL